MRRKRKQEKPDHHSVNMGVVGGAQLLDLYGRTDVFMCLSEHEGFGMPAFEAMRRGLPLVAWANSALAELLADHPLCSRSFDPSFFLAALELSIDPVYRDRIIEIQKIYQKSYDISAIRRQIGNALGQLVDVPEPEQPVICQEGSSETNDERAKLRAIVEARRQAILPWVEALGWHFGPTDFNGNFVSLYDLDVFELLAEETSTKSITFESWSGDANTTKIGIDNFSYRHGYVDDARCLIGPVEITHQHIIFGPYIDIPPGRYRATFLISVFDTGQDCPIVLEIANNAAGVIARRSGFFRGTDPDRAEVEFYTPEGLEAAEFRVWISGAVKVHCSFEGILVTKLPSLNDLVPGTREDCLSVAPAFGGKPGAEPVFESFSRKILLAFDTLVSCVTKSVNIDQACEARDRCDWPLAAKLFEKLTRRYPSRLDILVQYGNVSKEAGFYEQAENAYRRAIRLAPSDAEPWVQLGHLMKIQSKIQLAENAYLTAAMLNRTSIEAISELVFMGNDVSTLRRLARKKDVVPS